ncbi:type I glyceraldehyde-3-phosphate dehydrogenase [Candidatus Parcubacteria bacterium]|uniref:Type I glyceraldehyde-3-phosphate dehydrogenase n=1 Tax=Candidatus Kaiserbacteria bacterium CG10_big_fil_rev_8_21_14_0_10_47_16 TaxID=1974608 RepID=A0A2H0UE66_9BACT|nr:type I glyceraldehyde-3-phosphate dehydrogenase [Candidatus Parcubacteria bacterium]PIR84692.1 MAG: type I glyceraldehyde-3-phosphate dehydrogenase [Candidatus Kaiserbacteria bacterium CG10_big_fil_rev_8_21_14_0_10_47_16]
MKKTRVAINGFGRIGRTFFRMAAGHPDFDIVAVNDLGDIENLAYLLTYDTAYGRSPHDIKVTGGKLVVNGSEIEFLSEREPSNLPWEKLGVDIVIESTGFFTSYEASKAHLKAGAKRVVISAPVKDDPEAAGVTGATVLMGVNDSVLGEDCQISSNASCTTNATSPLVAILKKSIGIEKAVLNTVHAYTATQALIDAPSKKDFRKGRSAAQNIIPSSTGAAVATTKAHTDLAGNFDGIAMRVPVSVGSIVDLTFIASKDTTVEEVNAALRAAAATPAWSPLFAVTEEPIVSSDIIGAQFAAIADLSFTRVVGGNLVKVLAWYDNETSYTSTLVQHVASIAKFFQRQEKN